METNCTCNKEVAHLRTELDVMRGALSVLASAAMVAMDAREDRTALLQYVADLADHFDTSVVGDCPGREQRITGKVAMMDFLRKEAPSADGALRPKPLSLDFLGKQHRQLLQQVTGIVDRERERDQMIKNLVASLQAALGPKGAE